MQNTDGTGTCDKCGVALPNTGVLYCVILTGMGIDGSVWQGHLCTFGNKCADTVINTNITAPEWFIYGEETT